MKNTFLLDQYIALMECKLSLAKLHKEKRLAIRNNQFERAADLRELYEKLQAEGKYQEAKVVLEMSLVVGEWLGRVSINATIK